MRKQKIEDYFRKRLGEDEVFIDKNELWDSLGLEKEEKDRAPIWFLLSGFLGLIMLVVIGYYFMDSKGDASALEANSSHEYLDQLISKNSKTKTKEIEAPAANSIQKENLPTEVETELVATPLTTSNQIQTTSQDLRTTTTITKETEFETAVNPSLLNVTGQITNAVPKESNFSLQNTRAQLPKFLNGFEEQKEVQVQKQKALFNPAKLNASVPSLLEISPRVRPAYVPLFSLPKKIPIVIARAEKNWHVGAYTGVYYTQRNLEGRDTTSYLDDRENYESSLETVTAGVFMQRDFNENSYFKIGLEYQSINEKFEYASLGDTTIYNVATGVEAKLLKEWINYNHHRLFNIPLSLGYKKKLGNWNIFSEITTVVTLRKSFSGLLLESNQRVNRNTNHFKTGASLALRYGIGISYDHGDWNFYFMPSYQRHLGSFSKEEQGYTQGYSMLGAQLGLRYGF